MKYDCVGLLATAQFAHS